MKIKYRQKKENSNHEFFLRKEKVELSEINQTEKYKDYMLSLLYVETKK